MSVFDFIQSHLPDAISVSSKTGLPVDFILGQAGLESGFGSSRLAQQQNNFFGIGGPGHFRSYSDPSAGFQAYGDLISKRYDTSSFGGMNAGAMADSLAHQGYTPDAGYGDAVQSATDQIDSVLKSLGMGQYVSQSSSGTTSATTVAGGSGSDSSPFAQFTSWAGQASSSIVFVIIGILVLIAALFMFAKQSGAFDNMPSIPIPVE